MDLDQMKNTWAELSDGLSKKESLHDEHILKMTQKKSSSRLNRIIYLEIFGSIVSVIMLIYLLVNFHRLNDWLTLTGGTALVLIIGFSMVMSINIIQKAKKIDLLKNSYHQTLQDFSSLKKVLKLYKRLAIPMNIVMPFLVIPVFYRLFLDKNLLDNLEKYGESLLATFLIVPILLFFLIRYYKKNMQEVSKNLKSLEDTD